MISINCSYYYHSFKQIINSRHNFFSKKFFRTETCKNHRHLYCRLIWKYNSTKS